MRILSSFILLSCFPLLAFTQGDSHLEERPTLHVFIGIGQSLMVGSQAANTLVTIESQWPDRAFMFDTGEHSDVRIGLISGGNDRDSTILDPASILGFTSLRAVRGIGPGSRGETPMESFINRITSDADSRGETFLSLSFTAAFGGSSYRFIKQGTPVYENMLMALNRAVEIAESKGWRAVVAGCLVKHGEGDIGNRDYLENLLEWQKNINSDLQTITGQKRDIHFIIAQPTTHRNHVPESALAMLAAHNVSPFHHLSGADYPFGAEFARDELHMTGPGYFLIGEKMARAWMHAVRDGNGHARITQMTAAELDGATVVLHYEVPVPPLVFDTETVPARDTKGFRLFLEGEEIDILSAQIVDDAAQSGSGKIILELAAAPDSGDLFVHYALSPQADPRSPEGRVRGNVRDSSPDVSFLDGRPLQNWGVLQRIQVSRD